IKAEYESKIIFDYPLYKFREDKYSKEIKTLRTDVTIMERCMQAIIFSQYRLKVFQDNRLAVKPVILFKAAKIQDSKDFMAEFIDTVARLNAIEIERISTLTENKTLQEAFIYFANKGISYAQLAQELKDEFSVEHCISANDKIEAAEKQIALNSLEDKNNPYRAIFEVKKLDEGWDVLNLFDIVRLYETRQSGGKKISPATVSEAQLIGRGSRYCPFQIDTEQEKYKRKYDNDLDNPLRICEELYYHCQNDSRYIGELHSALREIGIDLDKTVAREYKLKADFKQDNLYKEGLVFINQKDLVSRSGVTELLPSVRDHEYVVTFATGVSNEDLILDDELKKDHAVKTFTVRKTFSEIARINYAIVQRALCKYPVYKFNTLQSYFPNLKSTREFITSGDYLGNIKIAITTKYENPPLQIINRACSYVVGKIANVISGIEETYQGTTEFTAKHLHEVFKDKRVNYTNPHDGGVGISQNDHTVPYDWKLDLSNEDWFVFEDNFGTSEEKAFVAYFKTHIDRLKMEYDKVYLVRNERQFAIYSFVAGERFEPDYVLFLRKNKTDGFEQMQIFVEPKGTHLLQQDSWKQDFLLALEEKAVPITEFVDDNEYKIWGFHFFNAGDKKDFSGIKQEFVDDMAKI
ncbi:MAG: methylase, partial [Anaerovoracaceae bacterium]